MKNLIILFVCFFVFSGAGFVGAETKADSRVVYLGNETGRPLVQVFVSPMKTNTWSGNLLNKKAPTGNTFPIDLSSYPTDVNAFDLRAIDDKGQSYVLTSKNVLVFMTHTFYPEDKEYFFGKGKVADSTPKITFFLLNQTSHEISRITIVSKGIRVGRSLPTQLADGERIILSVPKENGSPFLIRAEIKDNNTTYEKQNLTPTPFEVVGIKETDLKP